MTLNPADAVPFTLSAIGLRSRARPDSKPPVAPDVLSRPTRRLQVAEITAPVEVTRLAGASRRLSTLPRGEGEVVVDIPGYGAGELSGAPIRRYLRWLGYAAEPWGQGTNTGDPTADAERLLRRVEALADVNGAPVFLVGWSLGGVIGREIARRRPDLVRGVVTYGTPVVGGPSHTVVATRYSEETRRYAAEQSARLEAEQPIQVPITAICSRRDGIGAWGACIDRTSPQVDHVEVRSTHLGMGLDPDVWEVVATRLAQWR